VEIEPGGAREAEVWRLLRARKARLAAHPFYAWLREERSLSALAKLQRFVPMWTMDILGYRDLNKYALPYSDPHDPARQAVNAWAGRLSQHSGMFLDDWDGLHLDDMLGLSGSQTLEFVFLDPDMDLHRGHMIEFGKIALRHPDPAVRWWMMAALESTGEEFFAQLFPLARAVEADTGARLDYLCGRHDPPTLSGGGGNGAGNGRGNGGAEYGGGRGRPPSLTADTLTTSLTIVDEVFDAMESQLWRSLVIAQANKFGVP
jgi:hypothetical protein